MHTLPGKLLLILLATLPFSGLLNAKENYISLKDQKITVKNAGFKLKNVINATGHSTFIGFVSRSVNGKGIITHFENDISDEVFEFLQRNLEESNINTPLTIRIDELKISEVDRNSGELAIIKVAITFFFFENGSFVRKFHANILKTKMGFFSVTKHQPELIALALSDCFNDFYNRSIENKLENVPYTEEELYQDPYNNNKVVNEYFGLNRTHKGLYGSFYDFRYATPDTTVDFVVQYKTYSGSEINPSVKYALIYPKYSEKKINNVWGFCDGKRNYVNINNIYYPLYKDKNSYYIYARVSDNTNANNFGAAGYDGARSNFSYVLLSTNTGSNSEFKLNLLNGHMEYMGLGLFSTKVSERRETQVVLFSSRFNRSKSQLSVYINGKFHCHLTRGKWVPYVFPNSDDSIKIDIISSAGHPTSMVIYPQAYDAIILLCHDKKHKKPVVETLTLKLKDEYEQLMTEENRACPGPPKEQY